MTASLQPGPLLGGSRGRIVVHRNNKITVDDVRSHARSHVSAGPMHAQRGRHLPRPDPRAIENPDLRRVPWPSHSGQLSAAKWCAPYAGAWKAFAIRHGRGRLSRHQRPVQATRYHSLVVDRASMPEAFAITAEADDRLVMGVSHKTFPVHGVQFHPESIASEHGHLILKNFLDLAAQWNAAHGQAASVPRPQHAH